MQELKPGPLPPPRGVLLMWLRLVAAVCGGAYGESISVNIASILSLSSPSRSFLSMLSLACGVLVWCGVCWVGGGCLRGRRLHGSLRSLLTFPDTPAHLPLRSPLPSSPNSKVILEFSGRRFLIKRHMHTLPHHACPDSLLEIRIHTIDCITIPISAHPNAPAHFHSTLLLFAVNWRTQACISSVPLPHCRRHRVAILSPTFAMPAAFALDRGEGTGSSAGRGKNSR